MRESSTIWVFCGEGGRFPSGLFTKLDIAKSWIRKNKLTGVLTKYPLDQGVLDWAVSNGYFKPKKTHEFGSAFIQQFSSASQEHYHFENGDLD